MPSAEELLQAMKKGQQELKESDGSYTAENREAVEKSFSYDAAQIVVLEHKYGSLDDSQVDAILTGEDHRAKYELMRYAHATGNTKLARQIMDRLGKDGIRQTLLEATTNNLATIEQREATLEYMARGEGVIGEFLKGQIVPKGEPIAEQQVVKEDLDELRVKFGELLAKHGSQK